MGGIIVEALPSAGISPWTELNSLFAVLSCSAVSFGLATLGRLCIKYAQRKRLVRIVPCCDGQPVLGLSCREKSV